MDTRFWVKNSCCCKLKSKFVVGDEFLYNWLNGMSWEKKTIEEIVITADGFFYRFEDDVRFVSETDLFGEKYKYIV